MDLILITNSPDRMRAAAAAGVDRVMIDVEINGKLERQGHLDTYITTHTFDDVVMARQVLDGPSLLVRVNPLHDGSADEIERCIDAGADILMLPMFRAAREVEQFVEMVDGRARACLLLETKDALAAVDDILEVSGIDEVHVGLNDLHLDLKRTFMFELLADGTVERVARTARQRGIKFGIGGVAPIDRGKLSGRVILTEHMRLGSSQVILSRDFQRLFEAEGGSEAFADEVRKLRDFLSEIANEGSEFFEANRNDLGAKTAEIVDMLKRK